MPQLNTDILPVGSIIDSMLTETQFQSEVGNNWVLADGRNVAGSRYATVKGVTTVPDLRDVFRRGKGNGRGLNPDGDLALGAYTADKTASHTHTYGYTDVPIHPATGYVTTSDGGSHPEAVGVSSTTSANSNAANETAPKSVIVNTFIKIN